MDQVCTSYVRIRVPQSKGKLLTHQKLFSTQALKRLHAEANLQSSVVKDLRKNPKSKIQANL